MALTRTARNVSALPGSLVRPFEAGEELELGEAFYIAGDGLAYLARANVAATSHARGIVVSVNTPGEIAAPIGKQIDGCVFGPIAGFSDMDEGSTIWTSSATAGVVTQTQPSGAATWSHPMGYAEAIDIFFVLPNVASPTSNS